MDCSWNRESNWKARYSNLYSSRGISQPAEDRSRRISFLTRNPSLCQSMVPGWQRGSLIGSLSNTPDVSATILSSRSDMYPSMGTIAESSDLGGHETKLLEMVRAQNKENEEALDQTLDLPTMGEGSDEEQSKEPCVHALSLRFTDRSVSRSRFSRISTNTKRDMDIPSILAFTTSVTEPPRLEIPALQKIEPKAEATRRWSIRKAVCPVCSQKWRDKTAVNKVKNSGLKRNFASEQPTVIAPARLRTAITMTYEPRPVPASVDNGVTGYHLVRNTSTTWQLTRARKYRVPKLQFPETTASPYAAAPMAKKDLDIRVNKFLTHN